VKRLLPIWQLVERYGDHQDGWHLLFQRGETTIDLEVTEQQWRAFDSTSYERLEL
jgi:hypothetical protein